MTIFNNLKKKYVRGKESKSVSPAANCHDGILGVSEGCSE